MPVTSAPEPGNMTVPPMFGWGNIAILLTLVVLVAVAAFLLLAAGRADSGRSEFQAWLAGRSAGAVGEPPVWGPDTGPAGHGPDGDVPSGA